MDDLEERLRADLRFAAGDVEDRIDVEEALRAGRHALRARRGAQAVGAAALIAVAGLLGGVLLRLLPDGFGPPVVLGTISAEPSVPATPAGRLSASFDAAELGASGYATLRLTVVPGVGETQVRLDYLDGGGALVTTSTDTLPAGKVWYTQPDRHLVIGIVPEPLVWLSGRSDASKGVTSDHAPLDGIGGTAFWMRFEQAGGADSLHGFLWERTDGVVRDSLGNDASSARIRLGAEDHLVYRDEALDVIGVVPASGGGYSFRISDTKPGDLVEGGLGSKRDGDVWVWMNFGALPPGSSDLTVELGATDGEWGTAASADGWVFVAAVVRSDQKDIQVISKLSYTDADGKRVTFRR